MDPRYEIALARSTDVDFLAAIELAAATLLRGHAPEAVLLEHTSRAQFAAAQAEDRLWVARIGSEPVGFAHVEWLAPGDAHLHELDVHPQHGRRGIGTRLVSAVCDWAVSSGCAELTLTTFREVPWNMPFYARMGFEEIPLHELSAVLLSIVAEQAARGLERQRRVVMRYAPLFRSRSAISSRVC